MTLPKPFSWTREQARSGKFDGKFLIGVRTTGIYCLPSCPTHPPKPENVTLFRTEAECRRRACGPASAAAPTFIIAARTKTSPCSKGWPRGCANRRTISPMLAALARAAGVSQTKLGELFRDHAHLAPAQWLRRERVRQAAAGFADQPDKVVDIGFGAGFESESVFHRQFLSLHPDDARAPIAPWTARHLPAAASRRLSRPGSSGLSRPRSRRPVRTQRRQPHLEGAADRRRSRRAGNDAGERRAPGPASMPSASSGRAAMAFLHEAALRMLGLNNEVTPFESRHAGLAARRRGLRLPNLPTGFDSLAWGIIGQQINIKFAGSLRREIIEMAGEKIGDDARPSHRRSGGESRMCARCTSGAFRAPRRSYLIDAAAADGRGELDIESLHRGSAVAAEKKLTAQRGIGLWTARYVMLRGGFRRRRPGGRQRPGHRPATLHRLQERPDQEETAKLMAAFAPHRSLATMHLWNSLKDAPKDAA